MDVLGISALIPTYSERRVLDTGYKSGVFPIFYMVSLLSRSHNDVTCTDMTGRRYSGEAGSFDSLPNDLAKFLRATNMNVLQRSVVVLLNLLSR